MTCGKLIIISGPSGAGKSSVVKRLIAESSLPLTLSVSATTRLPRPGEVDGRDYHFLSHEDFSLRRERGEFLECKEVFGRGTWYGTLLETVSTGLNLGKWLILEIDVQGALAVLGEFPQAITVFVHPGSMTELENRLRHRATDSEDAIRRRLDVAAEEMALRHHYTHEIINETLDKTVGQLDQLLQQYQGEKIPCSKS
ncbi:MAG: guanylate kinase [Pirellula sp.]|jgi:guanylate kinase|nr:guanylate kinase [Pirellula sp.]